MVARWFRRPYLLAFAIGSLVMAFVLLRKPFTEFEWVYVLSARNLMAGRGLYALKVPPFRSYTYPPFMAVMSIPFALMPMFLSRLSWFLVNLGCILVIWRGSWKLIGGGRLEGGEGRAIDRREHLVAILAIVCAAPYLQSGLAHLQTDLLIVALLTVGCLGLTGSRDALAGISFGVAAGMKCTPLLWAPYLAWRGRWKAAILVPVAAVAVNLLPDLISRADGGGWWLAVWFDQFLRPFGRSDYLPGRWYAWILDNQSLSGAVGRWASTRCAWEAGGIAIVDRATKGSGQLLKLVAYGIQGAVLLISWYALGRGGAKGRDTRGGGPLRQPIEFGVVLLLMPLLSPMSSRPHFATMLLPALCLARLAVFGERRGLYVPLAIAAATAILGLPPWGRDVGRLTMWSGILTWGALSLLAGCVSALLSAEGHPGRIPQRVDVVSHPVPHRARTLGRSPDEKGAGDRSPASR